MWTWCHHPRYPKLACGKIWEFSKWQCDVVGQTKHTLVNLFRSEFNTLRPRQTGRHFEDAIFMCILLNENVWIPIKISLKFVPKGRINNIPALGQIMVWRRPGDKPLSLNQWWLVYRRIYASLGLSELSTVALSYYIYIHLLISCYDCFTSPNETCHTLISQYERSHWLRNPYIVYRIKFDTIVVMRKTKLIISMASLLSCDQLWPLLLTWFDLNPSMDKKSHSL